MDHLFKQLVVKEHHDQMGDYGFTETYTYKRDAAGYVEQIDTKSSDEGMAARTLKIKYRE